MTTFDTGSSDRDALLSYLHRHLIGPAEGPVEVVDDRPNERYLSGVLYPQFKAADYGAEMPEDGEPLTDDVGAPVDDEADDPVTMSGQDRPSSVGISFVTSQWSPVVVEVQVGRYLGSDDGHESQWVRTGTALTGDDAVRLHPPQDGPTVAKHDILDGHATVHVRWRRHHPGAVITAVLVNNRSQDRKERVDPRQCLYQVDLHCRPTTGSITRYPSKPHTSGDTEAAELELQYRDVHVYAIGHGCAATWAERADLLWVGTTFLPVHVVRDVDFRVEQAEEICRLTRLMEIDRSPEPLFTELSAFVTGYAEWIEAARASIGGSLPAHLVAAADRLLERAERAHTRMSRGIEILRDPANPRVLEAFALANRAMVMQMAHSAPELGGTTHPVAQAPVDLEPDYSATDPRWRPFQLGFLLLNIDGVVHEGPDRDLVDLIWFPTGGGKTEAYLGLAAFTIFHRRLVLGDEGAGTTVITRYTLRLLTTQQFQRAATLIAACELLRRRRPDALGSRPISIGIWVGGSNTPNTYAEAVRLLEQLRAGVTAEQGFQIESCPWCGTRVAPRDLDDEQVWGVSATNNSFRVRCVNDACPFSGGLPISSVDQDLYDNPPTMVVGTVDKFARAAWEPATGVFFGAGADPGPSLIIQDEFHLISGPLGTVVALYEAAFDVLMRHSGARPKIVAATATIRNADDQTRGVFGREVALFPPAGVDAASSHFVKTDTKSPGRAYAGVMPQGHTPVTGLVHVTAAQLQAVREIGFGSEQVEDAYSTLVVYHNSLRELGKTMTLALDDIPSRIKIIAAAQDDLREIDDDNVIELTSNVDSVRIPRLLDRLKKPAAEGIAFLASTNMISVGVDVPRLGTMTVVGQPKTTAEYIQATSRVGRDRNRPGLVVVLYSPSKPRDRSHYESFVPYHSALYRAVEPTSVTPFSVAARGRALHADLVVLVRHGLGLGADTDADRFDSADPALRVLVEQFLARARAADPAESDEVERDLHRLLGEWDAAVEQAQTAGGLVYRASGKARPKLLRRFSHSYGTWPTLDSMRNVDAEVEVYVRGASK
ncbi:helicase-related protein [Actinokineospora sp. NBRC 105648]|uniref:helicase-related protein n=1 Tax=Actinokineospora sp. NBRC 105648 TaxID=3032206 RepID=UPI0024A20D62|nr:helicase-related protein [Actinokineospora sp. NBRC 105648]GLZ43614.1 DNA helicase [Actinokineospora sp. NBRC 105648]